MIHTGRHRSVDRRFRIALLTVFAVLDHNRLADLCRVPASKSLSDQDQALFYSSWQYGVIRLLTSIDQFQAVESIAKRLNLSVSRVQSVLNFLISRDLCQETGGVYKRIAKITVGENNGDEVSLSVVAERKAL